MRSPRKGGVPHMKHLSIFSCTVYINEELIHHFWHTVCLTLDLQLQISHTIDNSKTFNIVFTFKVLIMKQLFHLWNNIKCITDSTNHTHTYCEVLKDHQDEHIQCRTTIHNYHTESLVPKMLSTDWALTVRDIFLLINTLKSLCFCGVCSWWLGLAGVVFWSPSLQVISFFPFFSVSHWVVYWSISLWVISFLPFFPVLYLLSSASASLYQFSVSQQSHL